MVRVGGVELELRVAVAALQQPVGLDQDGAAVAADLDAVRRQPGLVLRGRSQAGCVTDPVGGGGGGA